MYGVLTILAPAADADDVVAEAESTPLPKRMLREYIEGWHPAGG